MKRRRLTRDSSALPPRLHFDGDSVAEYQTTSQRSKGGSNTRRGGRQAFGGGPIVEAVEESFSLAPLLTSLYNDYNGRSLASWPDAEEMCFEGELERQIPDLLEARKAYLESTVAIDVLGRRMRPFSTMEAHALLTEIQENQQDAMSSLDNILRRKFKLEKHRISCILKTYPSKLSSTMQGTAKTLLPSPIPPRRTRPDRSVMRSLESVGTTPYASSFASRLTGNAESLLRHEFIFRDWSARSLWMEVMDDIHTFHSLAHSEKDKPMPRLAAPIDYQTLQPSHLPQLHELLARTFWPGINVSDSLHYSPEQCSVVATYKRLVIGAALLSSPHETYITYLVVRSGWEGSQIATNMLYLLLQRCPKQDVILHVSANNPAMLLYNRFGFKAEEFIVGFYEEYLDRDSRGSKNAFRLRLRR